MLAALGAVAPELMSLTGAIPKETGLPWFEAGGLFSASGEYAERLGLRCVNAMLQALNSNSMEV
jgi:hypothetical protein